MGCAGWLLLLSAQLTETSSPAFAPSTFVQEALGVEIHAFVSQGFIKTSTSNYLASSARGSFEFTEVGINFTKSVTEDLRGGIQFFARKLGPIGNYSAKLDWFYLDYRFADWLGMRAGRVKLPFGLYNETSDIDSARVPVLLPQSVYPTANRDYLLAQTGAEIYGYFSLFRIGELEYRLYGGTIFLDLQDTSAGGIEVLELETPYVVGGRLMWEPQLDGLRIGGSVQALELDTTFLFPGGRRVDIDIPVILWVGSIEYTREELLLAAEYSRWVARSESSDTTIFPDTKVISERGYFLAAYAFNDWFHPGVYYSIYYPDTTKRKGRENSQHDLALTLRFDINSFWLLKLEGHYMSGTALLSPTLNDGRPPSALPNDWFVFLAKTTFYF